MKRQTTKQFNEKAIEIETLSVLTTIRRSIYVHPAYIGLDTHKDTIAVSVAIAGELCGFIWDIVCHEMPKMVLTLGQTRSAMPRNYQEDLGA